MTEWNPAQFEFDEVAFCGQARLFPLPDLVLYPYVMRPLHVFEPRYREMVEDALSSDRLIAPVKLAPGWETGYESRPPVAGVACLGKIVTEHRLDDGCYNILLLGLRRVEIVREVPAQRPFRVADVRILADQVSSDDRPLRRRLRRELLASFQKTLPVGQLAKEKIATLLQQHIPLGVITDLIAFTADLDAEFKQMLLAESKVVTRAAALLARLSQDRNRASPRPTVLGEFPPRFSEN